MDNERIMQIILDVLQQTSEKDSKPCNNTEACSSGCMTAAPATFVKNDTVAETTVCQTVCQPVCGAVGTETAGFAAQCSREVPVGISNHHVHLCREDVEALFGKGYQLTKLKDLSQPGNYSCAETVTIVGPKGKLEKIRILGPERERTQVEVFRGDCFKLGVKAPIRLSGDLDGSAPVTLRGPRGSITKAEGMIIAKRHIHINPEDAARLGVHDGMDVTLRFQGDRGGTLDNVSIRVTETAVTECHLDNEEANAFMLSSADKMILA